MRRRLSALLPLLALAACAHHQRVAVTPPPVMPTLAEVAPPPVPAGPTPINANLTAAATLWHLRAGLNVAALACRGTDEATIIARYNALLGREKASLAAAEKQLSAEFKAGGGDWQDRYDDAMTRLYNFFSQSPSRVAFCTAAAQVLAQSETMAPGTLADVAEARLLELDAPFAAPPVPAVTIAAAAITPTGPAPAAMMPAASPAAPPRRPQLTLDLSDLPAN